MRILGGILGAVAAISLLAGPAVAQQVPKYGEADKVKTLSERNAEKEAENAYKRSLNNIPEQKSADPWGAVRSDNAAPRAAAKAPAKPKAKSADTTAGAAK